MKNNEQINTDLKTDGFTLVELTIHAINDVIAQNTIFEIEASEKCLEFAREVERLRKITMQATLDLNSLQTENTAELKDIFDRYTKLLKNGI
jgi:DnaJ-domain-containing protein 1